MSIYVAIQQLFQLIELIIVARILLSWFPNIDWWKQPFKLLNDITEPILAPFKKIIPPIGGFDLSPIAALFFLYMLETILINIVYMK